MLSVQITEMHSDSQNMCNEHLQTDHEISKVIGGSRMSIPNITDSQVPTSSVSTTPQATS